MTTRTRQRRRNRRRKNRTATRRPPGRPTRPSRPQTPAPDPLSWRFISMMIDLVVAAPDGAGPVADAVLGAPGPKREELVAAVEGELHQLMAHHLARGWSPRDLAALADRRSDLDTAMAVTAVARRQARIRPDAFVEWQEELQSFAGLPTPDLRTRRGLCAYLRAVAALRGLPALWPAAARLSRDAGGQDAVGKACSNCFSNSGVAGPL